MHTHRGAVENYVKKRKKREARVLIYFEPRLSAFELPNSGRSFASLKLYFDSQILICCIVNYLIASQIL